MFKNLKELMIQFQDETVCREHLIKQRWPDGKIICQYCGHDHCYRIENGDRFKCANKECRKRFRVTVGSIFEASNIPLNKWFPALYLILSHKKGISSIQLGKDLSVTQKTAWFMLHRIREQLKANGSSMLEGTVEVDEVYIGGKVGNMSKTKRTKLREEGNVYHNKAMVMGMVQRDGDLRFVTIGHSINANKALPAIRENVTHEANVITDSSGIYNDLKSDFKRHEAVNHAGMEYVRNGNIHTNTIEGAFSLLKRSIYGIYHQVTPKHLDKYCSETGFRYNTRKMKDPQRFNFSLQNIEGRLKYKDLIASPNPMSIPEGLKPFVVPEMYRRGTGGRPVVQVSKYGEFIARFDSVKEAAEKTGLIQPNIARCARGERVSYAGYMWRYE